MAQVDQEQFEYEKTNFLAVMPEKVLIPLPQPEVSLSLSLSFPPPSTILLLCTLVRPVHPLAAKLSSVSFLYFGLNLCNNESP